MNYYTKETKFGDITITESGGFITELAIGTSNNGNNNLSPVLNDAFIQLEEYFNKKRKEFSLPLNPKGTAFQQKVWSILYQIPYGETCTYKDIALKLNNANASRAIGQACNKNPIPIIIPCHRVVGTNDFGGYAYGNDMKEKLLNIETN